MKQKKSSGLLIVLLLFIGIVLGAMVASYGGFGKASITDRVQQYKSAQEGQSCVIDGNCAEALVCRDNICASREGGSGPGEDGEHENETPGLPGSE